MHTETQTAETQTADIPVTVAWEWEDGKTVPVCSPIDELRSYYERESRSTSLQAFCMSVFGAVAALTLGGIVDLFTDGLPVWIASVAGFICGAVVYALCSVAGECSQNEEE